MSNRFAVILAAGKGTRMKSKLYKVFASCMWKTYGTTRSRSSISMGLQKLVTVVGHGAEMVQEQLGNVSEFALQAEQLGTAHAVDQVKCTCK